VKKPGAELVGETVELEAVKQGASDEADAYERLLTDAMNGDATLFVRQDAVEAAWSVVEPVLDNVIPLQFYEPGSWGPREAERLATECGGWDDPAGTAKDS
jgi:glucose-6-phosphate 1-dehydrogenase